MGKNERIGIFVATNFSYLHHLYSFLQSRDLTQKQEIDVYVEVVNVPESYADFFCSKFERVNLQFNYKLFAHIDDERGYMTNRRILGLNELSKKDYDIIGYCDVNTLFLKDVSDIFKKNFDAFFSLDECHPTLRATGLISTPVGPLGTPYYGVCLAGVQFYRLNDTTRDFLQHYKDITKDYMTCWYADQEALFLTYRAFENKVAFKNIENLIALKNPSIQSVFIYEKAGSKSLFYAHRQNLILHGKSSKPFKLVAQTNVSSQHSKRRVYFAYRVLQKFYYFSNQVNVRMKMILPKFRTLYYRLLFHFLRHVLRQTSWKFNLRHFPLYLDLKNKGISTALASQKEREIDMTQIIQDELQSGDVCFDLGSNIGFYPTLAYNCVGRSGKVLCVEPDPRNIPILQKNIALLEDYEAVSMYHLAISSSSKNKYLQQTELTNLNVLVDTPPAEQNYEVVECLTVDDLCKKTKLKPDFIRMDIEGHEVSALIGMSDLVKKTNKALKIFFELHPDSYSVNNDLQEQLRILFEHGFKSKYVISSGKQVPDDYAIRGYLPSRIFASDGFNRGQFENVSEEDAIYFATAKPKLARYIFLERV